MKGYEQLSLFLETLRDSNIPIIVQALAWRSIPDSFREEIDKKHQVLWRCQ